MITPDEARHSGSPAGVAVDSVSRWLVDHIEGATAPFTFDVVAGGHSNLTYRVTGADGAAYVLRRPPLGHVLASAHDVGREHRIISGLQQSGVPVPPALGFCDDDSINGAPFYVMGFVDGIVVRGVDEAAQLPLAARANVGASIADTLAAIHAVDLEAAGLSDLARHEGYIARQLKRWHGQWEQQRTRDLPTVDEVHDELARRVPVQGPAALVHGDYRLDNTIVSPAGDVAAVLDWEICTLGDPMADVGLLAVYWTGPDDDETAAWDSPSTRQPGFWNRAEVVERYALTSGRDLSQLDFYVAFGYWKLACILEGVYARYVGGALGHRDPAAYRPFRDQVDRAAEMAAATLERLP